MDTPDIVERLNKDIDWTLLRKQKETLVTITGGEFEPTPETYARLHGLIGLLDYLQDTATDLGVSEAVVFGED